MTNKLTRPNFNISEARCAALALLAACTGEMSDEKEALIFELSPPEVKCEAIIATALELAAADGGVEATLELIGAAHLNSTAELAEQSYAICAEFAARQPASPEVMRLLARLADELAVPRLARAAIDHAFSIRYLA